jgi:hypothetical protein
MGGSHCSPSAAQQNLKDFLCLFTFPNVSDADILIKILNSCFKAIIVNVLISVAAMLRQT